jgi:hypothetical protein
VISFVADAVVENLICSLAFSSIIPYVESMIIFFALVSKFADNVGA